MTAMHVNDMSTLYTAMMMINENATRRLLGDPADSDMAVDAGSY